MSKKDEKQYPEAFYTTFIDIDDADKGKLVAAVIELMKACKRKVYTEFIDMAVDLVLTNNKGERMAVSDFCDKYNKVAEQIYDTAMDELCTRGLAELTTDAEGNLDYRINKEGYDYIKKSPKK